MRNKYQRKERKSNHRFEVVRGQELLVQMPLPIAEVWSELQAQVEELTGQAGLQILRAILENEVTRRVGPPRRPHPAGGCVRWGKQPGYVVFGVRTREGQEMERVTPAVDHRLFTTHPVSALIDWITSSAPLDRVNLVAVIRPRLGGKEPSDVDVIFTRVSNKLQCWIRRRAR